MEVGCLRVQLIKGGKTLGKTCWIPFLLGMLISQNLRIEKHDLEFDLSKSNDLTQAY